MATKNKYNDKARQKIKTLVRDIHIGMMVTNLGKAPLNCSPMATQEVDVEGNIWFLSSGDSEHNKDIIKKNEVQLLYAKPSAMEFLSIYGHAEIKIEQSVLEDLYNKFADNWFNGVNDPNLTAIKFIPNEAYYWDSESNKYINLFKLGMGAITGNKKDIGEKGKLKL